MSDVLKAYSDGKEIEYRKKVKNNQWGDWHTATIYHNFSGKDNTEYRIKDESNYRPYKNAEEFLQAQKEHGPYFVFEDNYLIFPIRVMPLGLELYVPWNGDNTVRGISYNDIVDFKWQDGTRCCAYKY